METLTIALEVTIRPLQERDLSDLEWYGHQTSQAADVARTVRRRGDEVVFLVAVANNYPVGRLGVDFARASSGEAVRLWSMAVMPNLQSLGIGSALMQRAEQLAIERGRGRSEIGVERSNEGARRLYERLGYRRFGEHRGEDGERLLLLGKPLYGAAIARGGS
jgi:GNAT superfamily N-acetyltransferase